ncbi:MAG: Bax inhibitor-1 family protein, partial [Bradymonadaceae bacterium]
MSNHNDPNHFEPAYDGFAQRGNTVSAAQAGLDERLAFIRLTYMHLAGAIFAFMGVVAFFFNVVPAFTNQLIGMMLGTSWLLVLGLFIGAGWVADWWARSVASKPLQYLGLGLGIMAYAVIFLPMLAIAIHHSNPALLPQAAITTLAAFAGLTAIVFVTKQDFSMLRTGLIVMTALAFGAIIAGSLFGFHLGLGFSII